MSERRSVGGPAGALECVLDAPAAGVPPRGIAVLCHPHPLHGGTMDNKVIVTLARTFVQLGYGAVRFNFRGVGASAGHWDEGRGEVDDALAVIADVTAEAAADAAAAGAPPHAVLPLVLAGFSFGGYVATQAAARLAAQDPAAGKGPRSARLVLVAPAAGRFTLAPVPPGTLVVHGEADDVVPLAAVLEWARPQSLPITLVPGAGHFFHGQLTVLKQIVSAALR
ncbi:MAG: alpha/beta hydrolase [Rubrivivax sp.]|nr:alpha/beta hydrolase [Rubrivivax sp.]